MCNYRNQRSKQNESYFNKLPETRGEIYWIHILQLLQRWKSKKQYVPITLKLLLLKRKKYLGSLKISY